MDDKIKAFLKDLSKLSKKHGLYVAGMIDIVDCRDIILAEDLECNADQYEVRILPSQNNEEEAEA
ncbi:hypothetical protein SAMN02799624_05328 [Paenibacillus sp. UNC496MF]|uniref:hypothetical protein n=1 Tax=Paenibacillus sp. UNC496MF TaxID=1502753 RepID=UPI0008EA4546|nr:hypothetical protein [Paenibacillus sp. UNC496MF]SFJ64229.1 hypothetical protein SAMN02799624_05328 [Paenibacillus sp. UNC496MF]